MKKTLLVVVTLFILLTAVVAVITKDFKKPAENADAMNLTSYVEKTYHQACAGEPIDDVQTMLIKSYYTSDDLEKLTQEEKDILKREITTITLTYVDQLYERASTGGKPIAYVESWGIAPLYDFIEGCPESVRKVYDEKIIVIAESYYQEYISGKKSQEELKGPFMPPARTVDGEPIDGKPGEHWDGPRD